MIDEPWMPGWLNFLLLFIFYIFLMKAMILFWNYAVSLIGEDTTIAVVIFAGGYLAKWREKQGGGWRFF